MKGVLFLLTVFISNFALAQSITSISPVKAGPGDQLVITGSNFNTTAANNIVYFGYVKGSVVSATSTSLTVTVPYGAGSGMITVVNTGTSLSAQSKQLFLYSYDDVPFGNLTSSIFTSVSMNTSTSPAAPTTPTWKGNVRHHGAVADFDNDGKPDIAISDVGNSEIKVYRNNTTSGSIAISNFSSTSGYASSGTPRDVTTGDINNDGKIDIIATSSVGIDVFINTSTTGISFATAQTITVSSRVVVKVADMDADGKLDILTSDAYAYAGSNITIYRNASSLPGSTVSFSTPTTVSVSSIKDFTIVDIDKDGLNDIVTAMSASTGMGIYLNTTSGSISFATPITFTTTASAWSVGVADMNMDGSYDIVVGLRSTTNMDVFESSYSSGTMSSSDFTKISIASVQSSSNRSWNIDLTDFNGDGKPDITYADFNSGPTARIITNNNTMNSSLSGSSFSVGWIASLNSYGNSYGVDMDSDGLTDYVAFSNATITLGRNDPGIKAWNGNTDTSWNNSANWTPNSLPTTSDDVVIPTGATVNLSSATGSCKNITIGSGATLRIGSGGIFQLAGAITNNGAIDASNGTIEMKGTSAQTIAANTFENNTIKNLIFNNSSGVTLGDTLKITGAVTRTNGTLTTGGKLVLKSTSTSTGYIAQLPTSGTYISGNVVAERYIPGKRAYRFFAHPFSSAIALSQLTDDIDITGSGGSTNGFTNTITNNPSAFYFDPTQGDNSTTGNNPGWQAFTSATTSSWGKGQVARIMVRGSKGEGLSGGSYTPSSCVFESVGAVNQGNQTLSLTKGSNTNFVLVGNPLPAPVDMDNVSGSNLGSSFYIWDATQGTRGAYTSYSFGSSSFVLPIYGGFVTTLTANGSISFEEGDKSSGTPSGMFKGTGVKNMVQLRIEDSSIFWDRLLLRFDDKAQAVTDYYDAAELYNPEVTFYTRSKDDSMLSIDVRPYREEVIPLGIYSTVQQRFKIVVSDFDMPAGTRLYLRDKYLNKTEELTGGKEYWFDVTADTASWGDDRFELNTQGTPSGLLVIGDKISGMKLVPNPVGDALSVYVEGEEGDSEVRVYNISGRLLLSGSGGEHIQLNTSSLAAGVYIVELTSSSGHRYVEKLIKQ